MKTACSALLLAFFLFLSQGVILAAETNFKPSELYQVHSIPDGTKTSFTRGDQSSVTKPIKTVKPSISHLTFKAINEKAAAEKSLWETLTESLSLTSSLESVTKTLIATVVIPAEAEIHKSANVLSAVMNSTQSSLSSLYSSLAAEVKAFQSQVSSFSYSGVNSLSKTINSYTSSVVEAVSSARSSISKQIPHNYKVAGTLMIMAIPFLTALAVKTPSGKLISLVGQALLSVIDLALHGLSVGAAVIQMFTTSLTFEQAYLENKSWIKRKSGRDIGTPGHDLVYGLPVILIAVLMIYAGPISVKVAQISPRIIPFIQLNAKPLGAYTAKVLQETSRECEMPGQCGTETDLAITLGVNTLAQGLPLEGPAVAFRKSLNAGEEVAEEGVVISKAALTNADDVLEETSDIGKAITPIKFNEEIKTLKNTRKIRINNIDFALSDHAIQRMELRNITSKDIQETISKGEKFKYFHEGIYKTGYYDSEKKIFIGYTDKITTVIENVGINYIENIKRAK